MYSETCTLAELLDLIDWSIFIATNTANPNRVRLFAQDQIDILIGQAQARPDIGPHARRLNKQRNLATALCAQLRSLK